VHKGLKVLKVPKEKTTEPQGQREPQEPKVKLVHKEHRGLKEG